MAAGNANQKLAAEEIKLKREKKDINTRIIFWSFIILFSDALMFTFPIWEGIAWFFGQFGAADVWTTIFLMLGGVLGFGSLGAGLYAVKQVQ
jgi:hypothetical protein